MITAKQPWHTQHNKDGTSSLKDANGDTLATFKDWQDAEYILQMSLRIVELEEKLEKFDDIEEELDCVKAEELRLRAKLQEYQIEVY